MNRMVLGLSLLFTGLSSSFALECGQVLNETTVMTEDLDCSNYQGYSALKLTGEMTLRGNGFKVISPNTSVGVYAEYGGKVKVVDLEVQGNAQSVGIVGYRVEKLVVKRSKVSDVRIGVDFYAEEDFNCDRLKVVESDLSSNQYGIKVFSPNCEYAPNIKDTDLSFSKEYALNIKARKVRITGLKSNIFDGSKRGLLLSGSEIVAIKDLELADSAIEGTQAFIYDSGKVNIRRSQFGNNLSEGIHIYDAAQVRITNVEVANSDVGIKVATEKVATDFKGRSISSAGNTTAGVILTSYGDIKFSEINFKERRNDIQDTVNIANQ
ncbi:MAG: hypothetical protein CME63_05110 [Halobacteriovoraceae bacterium]|nr:hypothetical protein [Halobacteriovoraceae bacterium]MBC97105.1 hypothetical protein [Halobacteriovoraceae bacterium]